MKGSVNYDMNLKNIFFLYLLLMNLVGISSMFLDKRNSRIKGGRRTPEKTLFLIALAGGAFGSLTGMQMFRHKTRHLSFQVGLPLLSLLWAGALVYTGFFH
jgi:uncharacterized membrane protein YsdA (DUF1294 family)